MRVSQCVLIEGKQGGHSMEFNGIYLGDFVGAPMSLDEFVDMGDHMLEINVVRMTEIHT